MEFLKHIFGFCGENHPSIINIFLFGGLPFLSFFYFLKNYILNLFFKLKTVIFEIIK